MKYFELNPSISEKLPIAMLFRWQWRVSYEYCPNGEWEPYFEIFPNRKSARAYIRDILTCHKGLVKPIPFTCFRNIKLQRRLVQINWHEYKDDFKWKNGSGVK